MRRNMLEWAVLAVSVASILLVVALLLLEGSSAALPADPRIELRPTEARQGSAGWILPAKLVNAGDEAAEAVAIEATATVAGQEETSEMEVDFLPAGTEVEVAFAFSAQPEGNVSARLVAFRVP